MSKKLSKQQVESVRKALVAAQGNKCLLCNVSFNKMTVKKGKRVRAHTPVLDHCHNHGHVRGVLCNNCNGLEGQMWSRANRCKRDRSVVEWAKDLVAYWEEHEQPQTQFIHPEHKTDEELRIEKNRKARLAYAKQKAKKLR